MAPPDPKERGCSLAGMLSCWVAAWRVEHFFPQGGGSRKAAREERAHPQTALTCLSDSASFAENVSSQSPPHCFPSACS